MKKLINDPEAFVEETIEGILAAWPNHLKRTADTTRGLMRADAPIADKVAIATGGGSGHLPVFLGYVGPGLCDGVSIGNVFSSPSMEAMVAVTKAIHGGAGVLYLYGNYGGDRMNFDMAAEMCDLEGLQVATVTIHDDVVSAPVAEAGKRRAVAGLFFALPTLIANDSVMVRPARSSLKPVDSRLPLRSNTLPSASSSARSGVAVTPGDAVAGGRGGRHPRHQPIEGANVHTLARAPPGRRDGWLPRFQRVCRNQSRSDLYLSLRFAPGWNLLVP